MVAEPRTWVDVEGAAREWARDFVPSVDRRVFFGPQMNNVFPFVVVQQIGGPDDRALLQFEVFADTKMAAMSVLNELAGAVDRMTRYRHEGVILHGFSLPQGKTWLPDTASDKPRYILDVVVTATAAT